MSTWEWEDNRVVENMLECWARYLWSSRSFIRMIKLKRSKWVEY